MVSILAWGCAAKRPPSVETAVSDYARAALSQDVESMWSMMSDEAQARISKEELKLLLTQNEAELASRVEALKADARVVTQAAVELGDGREVGLRADHGDFGISRVDLLQLPAQGPLDAVERFHLALALRDYQLLQSVLTPELGETVDDLLRQLEDAVAQSHFAVVDIENDRATVALPGGMTIRLKKSDAGWLISEVPR